MNKIRLAGALAVAATSVAVLAAPSSATLAGNGEGCTPGFFKNNTGAWVDPPLIPSSTKLTDIGIVFPANLSSLSNLTMIDALQGGGGPTLADKARILLRAGTASYLNAAVEISFPLRRTQVVNQINGALASGNKSTVTDLASQLDALNNADCPLSADEATK